MSIFDARAREFAPDVIAILEYQGRLAASVLALRRSARTDGLTGLPNPCSATASDGRWRDWTATPG